MRNEPEIIILIFIILAALIAIVVARILRSPFEYPYKKIYIDISRKRQPQMEDLVDRYLNANGLSPFILHYDTVQEWKKECIEKINSSSLKNLREKQYEECLDDKEMFQFIAVRAQTRYRQQNYMKSAYKVEVPTESVSCDINYLKYRYRELEKIGFQCTLSEYRKKDQRKLMTKALKEQIAVRDNYTCQICGKYMPDGVGLQIDHIIPIAKGGKSVPSNLQVLCSKCNGRKSKN